MCARLFVLGVSILPLSTNVILILELFRQCGIFMFSILLLLILQIGIGIFILFYYFLNYTFLIHLATIST